jgi:hypothetical protein
MMQFWVRDERLEDVITDRSFFHVSEICPVCDEINVCVEIILDPDCITVYTILHGFQVNVEEFS